jgi:hypothetical protein
MNRIFVCGDTHGGQANDLSKLTSRKFPQGKELTKDDYLIIAGDFGLIWDNVPREEELYYTDWLADKPWTTLFVDGNHENFDRINKLPEIEKFGGKVGSHYEGDIFHLKRGEIYTIGDKKIFTFGGGTSIDKANREIYISWWPQEDPSHFEFQYGMENLEKHNWKVDYVITHDCPTSIYHQFTFRKYQYESQLQKYLEEIKTNLTFKKWYFGHYHEDTDFGDKFSCLYHKVKEIL